MKETAAELASQNGGLTQTRALAVVRAIMREEQAVSIPKEAQQYFASELQRMVVDLARPKIAD